MPQNSFVISLPEWMVDELERQAEYLQVDINDVVKFVIGTYL